MKKLSLMQTSAALLMAVLLVAFNNCSDEGGVPPSEVLNGGSDGEQISGAYQVAFSSELSTVDPGGTASIPVRIIGTGNPNIGVTVAFSVSSADLTEGTDYTNPQRMSVRFTPPVNAGDTEFINIDTESSAAGFDLQLQLAIPNPVAGGPILSDPSFHLLNVNSSSNVQPPKISFTQSAQSLMEQDRTVNVTVQLDRAPSDPVTVDLNLLTQQCGPNRDQPCAERLLGVLQDFDDGTGGAFPTRKTLTFSSSKTAETVSLRLLEDDRAEEDEVISLRLDNIGSDAQYGSIREHHITIVNDDDGPIDNGGDPLAFVNCPTITVYFEQYFRVTGGTPPYRWRLYSCDGSRTSLSRLYPTPSDTSEALYKPPYSTDCNVSTVVNEEIVVVTDDAGKTTECRFDVRPLRNDPRDPLDPVEPR